MKKETKIREPKADSKDSYIITLSQLAARVSVSLFENVPEEGGYLKHLSIQVRVDFSHIHLPRAIFLTPSNKVT